ncbi:MAG: hypothetical protein Q7S11_02080 [bacterium]|nr:hypothetical protein [bacterium]
MLLKKKVASVAIAITIACTALVPSFVSAGEINHALASNPTAALAEIEKIGLPLSDADAAEMRGEGWFINKIIGATYNVIAGWIGSDSRFTLFSPLKACAPTIQQPSC